MSLYARTYAVPGFALDKHTIRGKGYSTLGRVASLKTGSKLKSVFWSNDERKKSHGPGRVRFYLVEHRGYLHFLSFLESTIEYLQRIKYMTRQKSDSDPVLRSKQWLTSTCIEARHDRLYKLTWTKSQVARWHTSCSICISCHLHDTPKVYKVNAHWNHLKTTMQISHWLCRWQTTSPILRAHWTYE